MSKASYKPLLFTTTLRNPTRLKGLLNILNRYDNQILTNDLAKEIMGEIIRYGLYRPTKSVSKKIEEKWGSKKMSEKSEIGLNILDDMEVERLLTDNPQKHKEAGFENGWPSRFATLFDFAKELGFVYFWIGEKIFFSEVGKMLSESVKIEVKENSILYEELSPELENKAFLNALVKYQRNNPFVKVLNENVPLILLLEVIQKINNDKGLNNVGISKLEIPFIIFWKNNNSEELFNLIKDTRKKYGSKLTPEIVVDICLNSIMGGDFKKFKPKSIIGEYPDEFIRKMRLTGLISIRGGGRYIDINKNEIVKVKYVLENYSNYKKYNTEKEYFDYASIIDNNLISIESKSISISDKEIALNKWVNEFNWERISKEMLILKDRSLSKDEILKYLLPSVRLEFLTALAIKSKFNNVTVIPNYPIDDEGLPTSTAGGNGDMGDIECVEDKKGVLVEVTMSEGRTQTMMEVWPIARHLEKFQKNNTNSICYFVAPSIFVDSRNQIDYVKDKQGLHIYPKDIKEFLEHLNTNKSFYKV